MNRNYTIKQNIPWFKTDYLKKKNWMIKKSPNYIFHYFKNSLAKKDINKIIIVQERVYRKILKTLKLRNKRKLNYYFYPSKTTKSKLMGDIGNGNAIWIKIEKEKEFWHSEKFEVHSLYTNKVKCIGEHEDTHLLSLSLGVAVFLFSEGLAEFMSEKWHQKDIDFWAKKYFKKKQALQFRFFNKQ